MAITVDISWIAASDGFRRVATMDVETGEVTRISAPGPAIRGGDEGIPGCKLADGRYAFPATGTPTSSLNELIHVLSADRASWTVVDTGMSVATIGFNSVMPVGRSDGKLCLLYYRHDFGDPPGVFTTHVAIIDVDAGSGTESAEHWPQSASDESFNTLEAPSRMHDFGADDLVLATSEGEVIYQLDLVTQTRSVWLDQGDIGTTHFGLTGAAYDAARGSVFVQGLNGTVSPIHRLREYSYPGGALLDDHTATWIGYEANGVIAGNYYLSTDPYNGFLVAERYDTATGAHGAVSPIGVGSYSDLWVIPNTGKVISEGHVRQRQAPGQVRQRQHSSPVRQRQNWR